MTQEVASKDLHPSGKHFKGYHKSKTNSPAQTLARFTPLAQGFTRNQEELDVLEFLARNVFIHRKTNWTDSLRYVRSSLPALASPPSDG